MTCSHQRIRTRSSTKIDIHEILELKLRFVRYLSDRPSSSPHLHFSDNNNYGPGECVESVCSPHSRTSSLSGHHSSSSSSGHHSSSSLSGHNSRSSTVSSSASIGISSSLLHALFSRRRYVNVSDK